MVPRPCLIFNPTARGEKAARFRAQLDASAEFELLPTARQGDARRLAREALEKGCRTLIAAGGDGTLNEVLNGMVDSGLDLLGARFGVVPLGTVNVFAQELGLPSNPAAALEVVRRGRERVIDLPTVQFDSPGGQPRAFLQMAGAGLDARAVELVQWELKKKIGRFAYVWAGLQALTERHARIRVETDAGHAEGELVIVSNGRLYGGPFALCPDASFSDGLLDVCVFPRMNWVRLPVCSAAALVSRLNSPRWVTRWQARHIRLTAAGQVPVQVDGESAGALPVALSVRPQQLRVLVP